MTESSGGDPGVTTQPKIVLYGLEHSHPVAAARGMLERKGLTYKARDIPPGLHPLVVRMAGFPRRTVPALRIDGRKVQGSLDVSRCLEEVRPDPPLFPADPEARAAVDAAERWGHDELQDVPRRIFRWASTESNDVRAWMAGDLVGLPFPSIPARLLAPAAVYFARLAGADPAAVRADLEGLPGLLDHVDSLIEAGTIGRDPPNAADFQILASVRSLLGYQDLEPIVGRWRCADAAMALTPDFPGPIPRVIPTEWLPDAGPAASPARRSRPPAS